MSGALSRFLYFARHGETDWNATGRLQGQTDIPLNTAGRDQARVLAGRMQHLGLVTIASSDLSRARDTAEIVARSLGLEVTYVDHAFRERGCGIFEGLTAAECEARDPVAWAARIDPTFAPPGGEPIAQVSERMLAASERLLAHHRIPALVVSHGRAIRELVRRVRGADVPPISNAAVYRVTVRDGALTDAVLLD